MIFSKVGKANAANATSILINCLKVNNIINIGTVGACNNKLTSHDLCIVKNAYYSDVDATCFKYAMNHIPQESLKFKTSKKLNLLVNKIINNKKHFFLRMFSEMNPCRIPDAILALTNHHIF